MKNFELHDFIEDYPCQNDNDIQWKTACRKEFNELASGKKIVKVGRFFNHQELFLRYLRQYNRIFNIQGTGTGKSGSVINAAEFYKANKEGIKRVYVLEPGPPTVDDFKSQIKKLSKPDQYINTKIRQSGNVATSKNNLTRLIKEWYSVETYQQFSKRNYSDEIIEKEYSDCIFFFDEAHKLRNLEDGGGGNLTVSEKENIYKFLWRVCHLAKRSKIIISTATPMINETIEFSYLANLLLPMDFQLPINVSSDFYDRVTLSQLEPFLRGKITFIKFLESGINIINMGSAFKEYKHIITLPKNKNLKGEPLKPLKRIIENNIIKDVDIPKEKSQPLVESKKEEIFSQAKIFKLLMKDIQLETYVKTLKETSNFFSSQRQSSVFVFPNGQFGSEGFKNYVDKNKYGNYQFKDKVVYRGSDKIYRNEKSLKKFFNTDSEDNIKTSLDNLELLSCKFKFFIEKELEASKEEKPGNSFCYIEYVESSGAILLGLLLKIFGFDEYKTTLSVFDIKTGKLENIEKRKRFALLTGQSKNIASTLELFNSPENKNGEYLQIIIASKLARDGVNIKNVLRGYIMTPGWHEAGMYQALSRFIRADSHDYLMQDKEYKEGKLDIEIFRLAAVRPDEEEILYKKGLSKTCIDVKNYIDSEKKDIKNKRILRFMKQTAFDAYLTYDRNIADDLEDYTGKSDYDVKLFKIWKARGLPGNDKRKGMALNQGPNSGDYIYNTYNIFYSSSNITEVKNHLIDILRNDQITTFKKFITFLKDIKLNVTKYEIYSAISDLVNNNENINNYQNTISYKIKLKDEFIYMKREDFFINNLYTTENNLYLENKNNVITEEIDIEEKEKSLEKSYKFLEDKTEKEITIYYIETQNYELFKKLLEDSLINLRDNKLSSFNKIILDLMNNYYIITDKPEGYIKAADESLTATNKGQGRKRAEGSQAGLKYLDLDKVKPEYENQKVYAHFYKASEKTAFGITSILESAQRKIRILEDDKAFKDSNIPENFVYNYLFTKKYDIIMKPYKEAKYYGTYIYRGGEDEKYLADKEKIFFRIVDNSNPRNKGIICKTDKPDHILEIIKHLDKERKYDQYYDKKIKIKKNQICNILIDLFRKNNLLFTSF